MSILWEKIKMDAESQWKNKTSNYEFFFLNFFTVYSLLSFSPAFHQL